MTLMSNYPSDTILILFSHYYTRMIDSIKTLTKTCSTRITFHLSLSVRTIINKVVQCFFLKAIGIHLLIKLNNL